MRRMLVIAAALCLGVLGAVTPAQAAAAPASFCSLTDAGVTTCYSSKAELLHEASGGRINVKSDAGNSDIDSAINSSNAAADTGSAARGGVSPAATVIVAYLYTDTGYTGSMLTLTSGNTCNAGGAGVYNNFASPWNNSISSLKLFAGCAGRAYDGSTTLSTGNQYQIAYQAQPSSLGGFNDLMSSMKTCQTSC